MEEEALIIYIYIIHINYIYDFIYLFLTVLGFHYCIGFSLIAASGVHSLGVMPRLLIVVASLVAEHGL